MDRFLFDVVGMEVNEWYVNVGNSTYWNQFSSIKPNNGFDVSQAYKLYCIPKIKNILKNNDQSLRLIVKF